MGAVETETTIVKTEIGYRKIEVTGPQYKLTIGDSEWSILKTNRPASNPPTPIRSTEYRCQVRNHHWETQSHRSGIHAWFATAAVIDFNCGITGVGTVSPGVACSYPNASCSTLMAERHSRSVRGPSRSGSFRKFTNTRQASIPFSSLKKAPS